MNRSTFTYHVATWGAKLTLDYVQLRPAKEALERARIKWSTQPGMVADMHVKRVRHIYGPHTPAGRQQYDVLVDGKWIPESEARP